MSHLRRSLVVFASIVLVTLARSAWAADNVPPRSEGLFREAERWLTAAAAGPTVASEPNLRGVAQDGSWTAEHSLAYPEAPPGAEQRPFVDFSSPSFSLVARDWHGSMLIVGDRTLLVDDLRPTASNRMGMVRLSADARLSTFVQLGIGQWRIDTAMFPNARSYSELAGQMGAGFELRVAPRLRLAAEASYTALYRDLHYSTDEVAPRMLAFAVAAQGRF